MGYKHKHTGFKKLQQYWLYIAVFAAIAVTGVVLTVRSHAETTAVALEAESGTLSGMSGNAQKTQDAGASGGYKVAFATGTTGGDTNAAGIGATPADCKTANVKCLTADSSGEISITTNGQILECQGHKVPRVSVAASNVTVQNCVLSGGNGEGVQTQGTNNTIQHNDISNIGQGDDGDINGITWFGNGTKLLSNKMHDEVRGNAGTSHTDCMQTWATPSHNASQGVTISNNDCRGPDASNQAYIHQCIMAEGPKSTDGGGGGSGVSTDWTVSGNYCQTYGNQNMKFDDIHNVTVTKNTFAGSASIAVFVDHSISSTDIKFLSDNIITGKYGKTVSGQ